MFLLVTNSNLHPILHCFRDTARLKCRKSLIFATHSYIPATNWGCSLWNRSMMLESDRRKPTLTSREIIFDELQPMRSQITNVTDGDIISQSYVFGRHSCGRLGHGLWPIWLNPLKAHRISIGRLLAWSSTSSWSSPVSFRLFGQCLF